MLTDWRPVEIWNDLNRDLTTRYLGENTREQLRLYQGTEHGIWEVTQGLAQMYPHRRRVIYFSHQDPCHNHSIFSLARDGFDMVALDIKTLGNREGLKQKLSKECLMILYSVDDPLMGR